MHKVKGANSSDESKTMSFQVHWGGGGLPYLLVTSPLQMDAAPLQPTSKAAQEETP